MNFDQYVNTLPKPTKKDFTITYWYKGGKTIATKVNAGPVQMADGVKEGTLGNAVHEETLDIEKFNAAVRAYRENRSRLFAQFKADVLDDLGLTDHPKAETLLKIAVDRADGGGFEEIYNQATELAELLI